MAEKPPYPYPPRITEVLAQAEPFPQIEPLAFTKEEEKAVLEFEGEMFEKLDPLRKLTPSVHTIFPAYLLTEEGWQKAVEIYSQVDEKVKEIESPTTVEEAEQFFFQLRNLNNLSLKKRREIASDSQDWARDIFLDRVLTARGDVDQIENPYRVSQIVDLEALKAKVNGYRNLKKEIKARERELTGEERLTEAKRIVLRRYRCYLNVLIAELHSQGTILARQPNLSEEEKKETLALVRGTGLSKEAKKDRFTYPEATRTLERMDHFLRGVGLKIEKDGFWATIPKKFAKYVERKCRPRRKETEEYKRYKNYEASPQQMERITQVALHLERRDDCQTRIRPDKGSFSFSYREKGEVIKTVNIPGKSSKYLPRALELISHEVNHALRHVNRDSFKLRLLQRYSSGRDEGLSEAAAMMAEERTMAVLGVKGASRVYFWALRERGRGGSFKDCFRAALLAQVGGRKRDLRKLFSKRKEFLGEAKKTFRSVLRIFRAGRIPFDDETGFLVNSEELEYHEAGFVAKRLTDLGLEKLLFIPGVDVYSLLDFQRLGVLDWEKIKTPRFVVANEIWPKLKKVLDQGKTLQEAIDSL